MHLLTISFYEFGQFLRIVLWIFLPLFIIVLLVTTYIHHRRKSREAAIIVEKDGLLLAVQPEEGDFSNQLLREGTASGRSIGDASAGSETSPISATAPVSESNLGSGSNLGSEASPESETSLISATALVPESNLLSESNPGSEISPVSENTPVSDARPAPDASDMGQPGGDNLYKGLLWMKQKFEDYREQTDQRIGTLKEQLEQRTITTQQLKDELAEAKKRIAELTTKLESNMSLLMNIHKELDRSLNVEKALVAATPEAASGGLGSGE